MSGSAKAGTTAERHTCELRDSKANGARSQERALGALRFSLTKDLHGCLSGGTGSTPVATATGVMTRREGRSSPKRVQAGSNPGTPASLKGEHGIAARSSGLQADDASSTLPCCSMNL